MKRIGFALVAGLGGVLCAPGSAEGQFAPPVAPPGYVTAGPVMGGDVTTAPARRGLLARLRDRRSGGSVATMPLPTSYPAFVGQPATIAPGTTIAPGATITPTSIPGTTTTIPSPMPAGPTTYLAPGTIIGPSGSPLTTYPSTQGHLHGTVIPSSGTIVNGSTIQPGTIIGGTTIPSSGTIVNGSVLPLGTSTYLNGSVIPTSGYIMDGSQVMTANYNTLGSTPRRGLLNRLRLRR
jgi:hypothetical protein